MRQALTQYYIYNSSRAVLTNAIFTGLLFEVEQASRGLSAIAELLANIRMLSVSVRTIRILSVQTLLTAIRILSVSVLLTTSPKNSPTSSTVASTLVVMILIPPVVFGTDVDVAYFRTWSLVC